jgi:macrophage erythroblast attacher
MSLSQCVSELTVRKVHHNVGLVKFSLSHCRCPASQRCARAKPARATLTCAHMYSRGFEGTSFRCVKCNRNVSMELECSSLQSALESSKIHVRALHRGVEREIPAAVSAASKQLSHVDGAHLSVSVLQSLDQIERLLEHADDKFSGTCRQIERRIMELQARLQIATCDPQGEVWMSEDGRLLRYVIDYLLREGHVDVAQRVADAAGLQLFCDGDLHRMLATICCALQHSHDCDEALRFCAENRSSLAKISSSLEVELRIQQLVVLVRDNNFQAAVQFARAKLAPFMASFPHLVQHAMMLLALRRDTLMEPYRQYFSEGRWLFLAETFITTAYEVFKVSGFSALQSSTLLGLTAAKTCVCCSAGYAVSECPACMPLFSAVVPLLPHGPRQHTALLCPLQRCVMDDVNPPLALPSGWCDARHHSSYNVFTFLISASHTFPPI